MPWSIFFSDDDQFFSRTMIIFLQILRTAGEYFLPNFLIRPSLFLMPSCVQKVHFLILWSAGADLEKNGASAGRFTKNVERVRVNLKKIERALVDLKKD